MMRLSDSDTKVMPVCWRRNRLPRLVMPWRLPATPCFTLPEAVKRKRFLAPLLVFILGIFPSFSKGYDRQPRQCPLGQAAEGRGLIAMPREARKRADLTLGRAEGPSRRVAPIMLLSMLRDAYFVRSSA